MCGHAGDEEEGQEGLLSLWISRSAGQGSCWGGDQEGLLCSGPAPLLVEGHAGRTGLAPACILHGNWLSVHHQLFGPLANYVLKILFYFAFTSTLKQLHREQLTMIVSA
uniref:Uncharacterized protein n=1 Tax=Sphaerodactylus townsendi TaxID=933632 RepID=A0ACB8E8E1_9SAUR